ncbi:hypothetical protein WAF17_11840 [Bernardetia sp. ABR2-2B]|uniref:hypothetical protein n=1 Tax=Bernardetia sp. ABR2-2B TaxID=3127472 RepID=UPI0030CB21AF
MRTQINSKRQILKLSFYSGLFLLVLLLVISFSPLELVFFEHQLIYWQIFFYGFISIALMNIYLMISSNNINSKIISISMLLLIYFILGAVIYSEKPLNQWKDVKVLAVNRQELSQKVFMQYKKTGIFGNSHRIIKKKYFNKYLNWCEEIYDENRLDGNWEVYEDFSF